MVLRFANRYGFEDIDVQNLQADIDALDLFERRYPDNMSLTRSNLDFQTAAKRMYYAEIAHQS